MLLYYTLNSTSLKRGPPADTLELNSNAICLILIRIIGTKLNITWDVMLDKSLNQLVCFQGLALSSSRKSCKYIRD